MLTAETKALLEPGCALVIGLTSPDGEPLAGRAWGITLLPGDAAVRLIIDAEIADVPWLIEGAQLAVTGGDVATLRSVQLKGQVLRIEPLTAEDRVHAERHTELFIDAVARADGTDKALLERMVPDDHFACEATIVEVYNQTPGPGAGASLEGEGEGPVTGTEPEQIDLRELRLCFEGVIPAVIATAAADGTPNVTYISRVRMVDSERVALSNQFFSKTARNLIENPRASLLLVDPRTYDQYRLFLDFERTERRGQVFERLRDDVDEVAALIGMQDVFKLRAADIYRVLRIERLGPQHPPWDTEADARAALAHDTASTARLAELTARLGRCTDLDTLVSATVDGLADVLGYSHSLLLLTDDDSDRLFTIASHGYEQQGVGSEVTIGEGIVGMAAARCTPIRIGSLRQMHKYARSVRASFEETGDIGPGHEIPVPGLADAESRIAVPAMALGQLVGILVVESTETVAFTEIDEALLTVIASLVANGIESERTRESGEVEGAARTSAAPEPVDDPTATHVRFFAVDGSTFLDGDYLIKGVAGRILWALLGHYEREGRVEFTNREVRLDPSLELPDFRDNFESRLILLKRRLDERDAPVRIEKTGRGRFQLVVETALRLEAVSTD